MFKSKKLSSLFGKSKSDRIMFELTNIREQLYAIHGKIEKTSAKLDALTSPKKPLKTYRDIVIENVSDFNELKNKFEKSIQEETIERYKDIQHDLQECVIQYDRLLYYNRDTIGYTELVQRIIELDILRNLILSKLFIPNKNTYDTFYLYLINNFYLNETVNNISNIDLDRVFLLDNMDDVESERYAILHIQRDKITLITPDIHYEFESKYKKTVLRVLYSIYMNRYYLYHLQNP